MALLYLLATGGGEDVAYPAAKLDANADTGTGERTAQPKIDRPKGRKGSLACFSLRIAAC